MDKLFIFLSSVTILALSIALIILPFALLGLLFSGIRSAMQKIVMMCLTTIMVGAGLCWGTVFLMDALSR